MNTITAVTNLQLCNRFQSLSSVDLLTTWRFRSFSTSLLYNDREPIISSCENLVGKDKFLLVTD